jgi:putative membrane protein (TIGR04086 family)
MVMASSGTMQTLRRFPVLYGITWALLWAVICTLILASWAHFGSLSDWHVIIGAYIMHCVASLAGGIAASRAAMERGWYYGGLVGLTYAVIMVLIGLLIYNTFTIDGGGLFRVLLMALIGAFGGIIGVNSQHS